MDATWLCGGNLRRGCRGGCVQPPARHAGQARDAYGWGNQSVEVPVSVSVKVIFVELYAMWYVFYIYIIYIGWSTVSVEVHDCEPWSATGRILEDESSKRDLGWWTPLGREPAWRRAKTRWTSDGIHWALVATWCPHRACASPYKGHPTLSSYKARA